MSIRPIPNATYLALLLLLAIASAQTQSPKSFASPEEAAKALLDADEHNDISGLLTILGSGARELISSGDDVQDKDRRQRLVEMAKESLKVVPDPAAADRFVVSVGKEDWPLPIPLIKSKAGYRFDAMEAKLEILARRVGRNELKTIEALRKIVDAEREYAYSDVNKNGMKDYAQRFISKPGERDGLYWDATAGGPTSPLADLVEEAAAEGYDAVAEDKPSPYYGYIFRILKAQGPDAPGGARDYVVRGEMIGGFAVVAYPIEYGVSGVKTFLVNHDGVVWEKDLGPNTKSLAATMRRYNPDKTWTESPSPE